VRTQAEERPEKKTEQPDRHGDDHERQPAAVLLGQRGRAGDGGAEKNHPDHHDEKKLLPRVAELARAPAQAEDRQNIEEEEGRERDQRPSHDRPEMAPAHRQHGHGHPAVVLHRALEDGALGHAEPHVQAHQDQDAAGDKGNAPAEGEKLRVGEEVREKQEKGAGADEAHRGPELGKHAVPSPPSLGRVLRGEKDGPAPFAPEAKALSQPAGREQKRSGHPRHGVGGEKPDCHGGNAHGEQGRHQRRLPPDAVAEVPEEDRADGTREEGEGESGQGLEDGRTGGGLGKEQPGKGEHRRVGVDVEIEKLDGGARHARKEKPALVLHPLTVPAVSPEMNSRCRRRKRHMIGATESSVPAVMRP